MRKVRDGMEWNGMEWKIMMKIVATNVVASRPPNGDRLQRRPLVPIYISIHEPYSAVYSVQCSVKYLVVEEQVGCNLHAGTNNEEHQD